MSRSYGKSGTIVFIAVVLLLGVLAAWIAPARGENLDEMRRRLGSRIEIDLRGGEDTGDGTGDLAARRDLCAATAREARTAAVACATETLAAGPPDPAETRLILLSWFAFGRALVHEAARLSRLPSGADVRRESRRFHDIWNEMADSILQYLRLRPDLGRFPLRVDGRETYLIDALTTTCSPEAFSTEDSVLPTEALFRRMASLPDSLCRCCLSDDLCRARWGAGCRETLATGFAGLPELDALVGFEYARLYWSLPDGRPPRDAKTDRRVARALLRAAGLMVRTVPDEGATQSSAAVAPLTPSEAAGIALAVVEAVAPSARDAFDPFQSVPGLRNARRLADGRLVCDVAIWRSAYEAADDQTRESLEALCSGGAKVLLIDP